MWGTLSRHERGYGKEWDKLRLRVLDRDMHLCQCSRCKASGRTTLASEVDHVVPKAKARRAGWSNAQMDSMSNLQAINRDCHKIKTTEEQGGTAKALRKIGLDGFPL